MNGRAEVYMTVLRPCTIGIPHRFHRQNRHMTDSPAPAGMNDRYGMVVRVIHQTGTQSATKSNNGTSSKQVNMASLLGIALSI